MRPTKKPDAVRDTGPVAISCGVPGVTNGSDNAIHARCYPGVFLLDSTSIDHTYEDPNLNGDSSSLPRKKTMHRPRWFAEDLRILSEIPINRG
jgi:hypothetical protein